MSMHIGFFEDMYNKFYIKTLYKPAFINQKALPFIDQQLNELIVDLYPTLRGDASKCSALIRRKLKVMVMKEYFGLPNFKTDTGQDNALARVTLATQSVLKNQTLKCLPAEKFLVQENVPFSKEKERYLKGLDQKKDRDVYQYLNNKTLKDLAAQIDQDMSKAVSLQEIAEFITIKYPNKIHESIKKIEQHQDQGIIGMDPYLKACLALVLLQKNKRFFQAIQLLDAYRTKSQVNNENLAILQPNCLAYQTIFKTITRIS